MSNFPWYSKYPKGVAHEIGPLEYQSVQELFETASRKYKDKIAFVNLGEN